MPCHAAALSACYGPAQELEGVTLPYPELWSPAFLQQFRRLRALSLLDGEALTADERELLVDVLPTLLERLRMTAVSPLQVASPSLMSVLQQTEELENGSNNYLEVVVCTAGPCDFAHDRRRSVNRSLAVAGGRARPAHTPSRPQSAPCSREKHEAGGTLVRADAPKVNMCDSVHNPTCFSRNLVCTGT